MFWFSQNNSVSTVWQTAEREANRSQTKPNPYRHPSSNASLVTVLTALMAHTMAMHLNVWPQRSFCGHFWRSYDLWFSISLASVVFCGKQFNLDFPLLSLLCYSPETQSFGDTIDTNESLFFAVRVGVPIPKRDLTMFKLESENGFPLALMSC